MVRKFEKSDSWIAGQFHGGFGDTQMEPARDRGFGCDRDAFSTNIGLREERGDFGA